MWVSGRLSGETAMALDDVVLIAAGLNRAVSFFLPLSVRDVLDVEQVKSRPLRSRPVRHPRSRTEPTARYVRRPDRPTDGRPKGRPAKQGPNPATRRPVRIDSPTNVPRINRSPGPIGRPPATAVTSR